VRCLATGSRPLLLTPARPRVQSGIGGLWIAGGVLIGDGFLTVLFDPVARFGKAQPLPAGAARPAVERRAVSKRWLSGTVLTALSSCALMSMAFSYALDGSYRLVSPPRLLGQIDLSPRAAGEAKEGRLYDPVIAAGSPERRLFQVATLVRDGDRSVVRNVDLVQVRVPLGIGYAAGADYPPFDPLAMFAETDAGTAEAPAEFYLANTEPDVALRTMSFGVANNMFDRTGDLTDDEVESLVREQSPLLTAGEVRIAALHYVDPTRFGEDGNEAAALAQVNVKITTENVSSASVLPSQQAFREIVIDVEADKSMEQAIADSGLAGESSELAVAAMADLLQGDQLKDGQKFRVSAFVGEDNAIDVQRLSLYNGVTHVASVAVDDDRRFIPAAEPEPVAMTLDSAEPVRPQAAAGRLASLYDAVNRGAAAYGINSVLSRQLVRLMAAEVDLRAKPGGRDYMEVLFSNPDGTMSATDESATLYVRMSVGGDERSFYRFEDEKGSVDFYDEKGRSARQFLLRNPVPNGRFRSGFGPRRHPILGYVRMHTGVDYAAPRGTPIIAAGSGVVEKAGWAGAYGKQTIVRHANGYKSSYSHQNTIAKGVVPGARVRQGQVIGTVGSTGLSTGPHLHYELIVNDTKVDPMRVRLPGGRTLAGEELRRFEAARDDIRRLMERDSGPVASL
jgi:murein DD-endopeptidase MepM/ murein hydrolase activator NlpD